MSKKINKLLEEWPTNAVATQSYLNHFGISRSTAGWYVKSGILRRVGTTAYTRANDQIDWRGGVFALQTQLNMNVHVAGQTALELQGHGRFIPMGGKTRVVLISDPFEKFPAWFARYPWKAQIRHHNMHLFDDVPALSFNSLDCRYFSIKCSGPEQAVLEQIHLAKNNNDYAYIYTLMEGLSMLRPSLLQPLLDACRSIKVTRYFLWCAKRIGHPWFEHLDIHRIDVGKGKRQLYKGGTFDAEFGITVPGTEDIAHV